MGESPSSYGRKRFVDLILSLRRATEGIVELTFTTQTNATLIDPGWIDVFEKTGSGVGVSIDGPAEVNDAHRFTHKGAGSYTSLRRGWDLLQDAHKKGRIPQPGVLCVINPEIDGAQIYRHFVDDLSVRTMNFLLPAASYVDRVSDSFVKAVTRYREAVYSEWARDADYSIRIRFVDSVLVPMMTGPTDFQGFGTSDLRSIISISSNGDIGPEDVVRTLDPRFRHLNLNVRTSRLQDVFESELWEALGDAATKLPVFCQTCEWAGLCRGGSLVNRFAPSSDFRNPSVYCESLRSFYSLVRGGLLKSGFPADRIQHNIARRPRVQV